MSNDEWDYYFDLGFHPDYLEELEKRKEIKNGN